MIEDLKEAVLEHWQEKRRLILTLFALNILVFFYLILGFVVIPKWLHNAAESSVGPEHGLHLEIGKISANPLKLAVSIHDLRLEDLENPHAQIAIENLILDFSISTIWKLKPELDSLYVGDPRITIQQTVDGEIAPFRNREISSRTASDEVSSGPAIPEFAIGELRISQGEVVIMHRLGDGFHEEKIRGLNFFLSDLAYRENGILGAFSLTGILGGQSNFTLKGSAVSGTPIIGGQLQLNGITLEAFQHYWTEIIPKSELWGSLSASADYEVKWDDSISFSVSNGAIEMSNTLLFSESIPEPLIEVGEFNLKGLNYESSSRIILVESIKSSMGQIRVLRNSEGLIAGIPVAKSKKEDESVSDEGSVFRIKDIKFEDFKIILQDDSTASRFDYEIVDTDLSVQDFGFPELGFASAKLSFGAMESGLFAAEMNSDDAGLSYSYRYEVNNLAINPFDAFVGEIYGFDQIQGLVTSSGSGSFLVEEYKGITTGNLLLSGLMISKSDSARVPLLIDSLDLSSYTVNWPELQVEVGEGKLDKVKLNVWIDSSGQLWSAEGETEEKNQSDASIDFLNLVGPIVLSNGTILFEDLREGHQYKEAINDLSIYMDSFGNSVLEPSGFNLVGSLSPAGSLTIEGTHLPLDDPFSGEYKLQIRQLDLNTCESYIERFLGYKVGDGYADLSSSVSVKGTHIDSENKATLIGFELGESVENDTATDLPVSLALGLLRDKDGNIEMDIPISGNLTDPTFGFSDVIWDTFTGLVIKTASSPLSILDAIIPEMEENKEVPEYVEFQIARLSLEENSLKTLESYAAILNEKRDVKLSIKPHTYPNLEADAIRKEILESRIQERMGADITREMAIEELFVEDFPEVMESIQRQSEAQQKQLRLRNEIADAAQKELLSEQNQTEVQPRRRIGARLIRNRRLLQAEQRELETPSVSPTITFPEEEEIKAPEIVLPALEVMYQRLLEETALARGIHLQMADTRMTELLELLTIDLKVPSDRIISEPVDSAGIGDQVRFYLHLSQ